MESLVVILFLISAVVCLDGPAISMLQKTFNESSMSLGERVSCKVNVTLEKECMLTATLDECVVLPTLRLLQSKLFPKIDLQKASGGFINNIKLRVQSYVLNTCIQADVYYELSLASFESYDLAEGYLSVNELKLTATFPVVASAVNNLADLSISEGIARTSFGGNNSTVSVESLKGKRTISYDVSLDILPLEDIIKNFQLGTLEGAFGKQVTNEKKLTLFQFIDVTAVGYSAPGVAFEFEISGKVNGADIFSDAPKVYLVLQKYTHELKDVKCLLFAELQRQNPSSISKLMNLGENAKQLPLLDPYDGKVVLTISNDDFTVFNNEGIKHTASLYASDQYKGNIINKGTHFLLRLKRDSNNDKKVTGGYVAPKPKDILDNSTKYISNNKTVSNVSIPINNTSLNPAVNMITNSTAPITNLKEPQNNNLPYYYQTNFQQQPALVQENYAPSPQQQYTQKPVSEDQNVQTYATPEQQLSTTTTYQQRQDLPHPENFFYVRTKREEGLEIKNSSGSLMPNGTQLNTDLDDFLIFECEVLSDKTKVLPIQEIVGSFEDILTFVIGDSESQGKDSLPLDDDNDYQLVQIELIKISSNVNIKIVIMPTVPLVVIPSIFKIDELQIAITRTIGRNSSWSIAKHPSTQPTKSDVDANIIHDDGKYFVTGKIDLYGQDELLNKTVLSPLEKEYKQAFPELLSFPFKNATYKMELTQKRIDHVSIEARSLMFDGVETRVENLIWRNKRLIGITTAVLIEGVNLNDFLASLYNKRMLKTCWLTMKEIGIVFSSKKDHIISHMIDKKINNINTPQDDSILLKGKLAVNLKTGCMDEPICNFIRNHITHSLHLNIEGKIHPSYYSFTSKLHGVSISFGDVWGMNQLEFTIAGTSERSSGVSLSGNIIHKETKHIGKFFVGEDKTLNRKTLEIIFQSPWRSFLGFTMVTLKNMISEVDISSNEKIKEIEFDATIELGNSRSPLVIENGKAIVSMRKHTSTDVNVVYGAATNVSMSDVVKSIEDGKMAPLLQKVKLRDTLCICFTNNEKGYKVKKFGSYLFTPSIHGVSEVKTFVGNTTAIFEFNTTSVTVHFETKQLRYFEGKLIFQKSEKLKKNGPEFFFRITDGKNQSAGTTFMTGYLKTIGYEASFAIPLKDSRFKYNYTSYLFNEIKLSANITGRLDQGMNETKFATKIYDKKAAFSIKEEIKNFLGRNKQSVKEDLLENANRLKDDILSLINKMKHDWSTVKSNVENKRSNIFQNKLTIEQSNEIIKKDCTENCGKECVTALDWDHDCSTVRGQKFGCLKWKKCQAQASNTKCIAKCESKKIPATITAYERRDDIRNLVQEVGYLRHLLNIKEKLLNKAQKLYEATTSKINSFKDRFKFLMITKTDRKDLFSWTKVPPTSIQRLANIKIPCLRYDVINYKYLGQPYTVYNKQICMNGRFFKDFAVVVLNGVDKSFSKLSSMKDETLSDIVDSQTELEKLKVDYQLELEKEKSKEYEKDDGDDEDDTDDGDNVNPGFSNFLLNSATNNSILSLSKRSTVRQEDKEDKDIMDATEIEIMPYLIKSHKTEAAFESDAPWVYMNKKRGLTIPALGILLLRNSTEDEHCAQRLDAIEHFEDLETSLNDVKDSYDEGMKSLLKEKNRLHSDKKEIEEEINDARTIVSSNLGRADMVYWLHKYKDGITEYLDSATKQLDHQNKVGLKYWKTQLSSAVRTSIAPTASKYFEKLRQNVLKAREYSKRSRIDGEGALDVVTKEFLGIVEKEPVLSELGVRLAKITQHLDAFKKSSLTCAP